MREAHELSPSAGWAGEGAGALGPLPRRRADGALGVAIAFELWSSASVRESHRARSQVLEIRGS